MHFDSVLCLASMTTTGIYVNQQEYTLYGIRYILVVSMLPYN